MAVAVKFQRAELSGLSVLVKAVHEQDIAVSWVPSYEFSAIVTNNLEAIALGRHEELLANGNDLGIDFDSCDQRIGQIFIAIFRQRSSAEPDDLDCSRSGIEQKESHHLTRIVEHQPVRVVDIHHALHKGPICQEAAYVAQLEDERGIKSALLHQIRIVTVSPISFEVTLFAVDIVEMIEKLFQFASRPTIAVQGQIGFGSASHVVLDFQTVSGPICHRRDGHFADRARVPLQR